jgi:DinB family protein
VRRLDAILKKLSRAQTELFRAADSIPAEQWNSKPKADAWSAAEVLAHVVMVERAIVGGADRITRKTPKAIPMVKRFHLPLWFAERRILRLKAPIPLDRSLLKSKEEMLGELRAARERTLAFLEETAKRDLKAYCWPHPFLGMLNAYEWFELVASHEIRHMKQMREIGTALPKAVEIA